MKKVIIFLILFCFDLYFNITETIKLDEKDLTDNFNKMKNELHSRKINTYLVGGNFYKNKYINYKNNYN